ncbi:formylglycine-generating enzyme family protein [Noviherbaspirillum denitrificans]|nr:formylglycine-generating enzyme family protein [Noviherbaspirillum denitrificans]
MTTWSKWIAGAAMAMTVAIARAAAPLPQEVTINNVEFILIPEGWFYKTGGITPDGVEWSFLDNYGGGDVKVWLDSYYIAKYEARARDLVRYLNSDEGKSEAYSGHNVSCSAQRGADGKYVELRPDEKLPATHMTWYLADRWSRWMGFRLLTEAEWEKAARGPDHRMYPWGDDFPDETYAGYNMESACFTWPVDSFRKGLSPYGVYNMSGNVREFVADWYNADDDRNLKDGARNPLPAKGSINAPDVVDPGNDGPWKLLKGGRWGAQDDGIRVASRVYFLPDDAFRCNGVRFGLDTATVREHLAKGTAVITRQ